MLIFWRHRLTVPCFFGVLMLLTVALAAYALQTKEPEHPADARPMPKTPPVSAFAPTDDLTAQAKEYLVSLKKSLAEKDDYEVYKEKIAKEANTLAVIALALGLHDKGDPKDNPYQANAGAMIHAAQRLAATKDYAAAKSALAKLQAAAAAKPDKAAKMKWEKVASLPELMKQVPTIHTKLKRNLKESRFKKKAKQSAGYTAVLAAIAQGAMPDLSAAKTPEQVGQWYKFTEEMRKLSAEVNKAIRASDQPAAAAAQKKLQKNCEDCHAVFKPDAVIED
jgi:hypothetical protein